MRKHKKGDEGYTYAYSGDKLSKDDLSLEAVGDPAGLLRTDFAKSISKIVESTDEFK